METYQQQRREWTKTIAEFMNPEKNESSQEYQDALIQIKNMNQYAHLGLRYLWSQIERNIGLDVPDDRRIRKVSGTWQNLPSFDFVENAVPLGFTHDGHLIVHNVFGETLVLQELRNAIEQPGINVEYTIISRTLDPEHEKIGDTWKVEGGEVVLNERALESIATQNRLTQARERAAKYAGLAREQRALAEKSEGKPGKEGDKDWVAKQIQKLHEGGSGNHRGEAHR